MFNSEQILSVSVNTFSSTFKYIHADKRGATVYIGLAMSGDKKKENRAWLHLGMNDYFLPQIKCGDVCSCHSSGFLCFGLLCLEDWATGPWDHFKEQKEVISQRLFTSDVLKSLRHLDSLANMFLTWEAGYSRVAGCWYSRQHPLGSSGRTCHFSPFWDFLSGSCYGHTFPHLYFAEHNQWL